MKFLKSVKKKDILSDIIYHALNIGMVILLLVLVQTVQSLPLAVAIVLLSKWRIFAVRPRFWWVNLQANAVDIIVGVSTVVLMYQPQAPFSVQLFLAILYGIWLTIIKPLSKRWQMMLQSGFAVTLGTMSLFATSYEWPLILVVVPMFAIGYSAARHFLFSYDEGQIILLSTIWGVIFAEIGWLAHHWAFSYPLPLIEPIRLPQATIIVLLISFLGERVYRSWKENDRVVPSDVMGPAILAGALIFVILIFFNSVTI